MRLQVVLNEEETNKWIEMGEEADRYRMMARTSIRACLTGLFSEIEVANHDRNKILETIRKEKCVAR